MNSSSIIPKKEQQKILDKYKDKTRDELIQNIFQQEKKIDKLNTIYTTQTKLNDSLVRDLLPKLLKIKKIKEKEESLKLLDG